MSERGRRAVDMEIARFMERDPRDCGLCPRDGDRSQCPHVRRYSTDIAAAWAVVTVLAASWPFSLFQVIDGSWCCSLGVVDATADTAPLAICRAALAIRDRAEAHQLAAANRAEGK